MTVWKSSCRKRAHPDMAAATPASGSTPAPALLSVQPGSMLPLAGALQTTLVPLLQQQQQQEQQPAELQQQQQQQQQHQKEQELVRTWQTPAETPVAPQLQQAACGQQGTQLRQQLKLPVVHAQAQVQVAKQAYVPIALQAKQVDHVSKHAGPAKQAQTAVLVKQTQHAQHAGLAQHAETQVIDKQTQQAQHASPAKQAQHAPQQAQRAPYALPAEHSTQQAAQQAKRMLSGQQDLLPQIDPRGQNAAQAQCVKVSERSEQLTSKRPAPSSDVNSSVKRHKVSMLSHSTLCYLCCVHSLYLH